MFDLRVWLVARQEIPHLIGVHKGKLKGTVKLVRATDSQVCQTASRKRDQGLNTDVHRGADMR